MLGDQSKHGLMVRSGADREETVGKVGGVTKARAQPHPASVVQNLETEIFFFVYVASIGFQ